MRIAAPRHRGAAGPVVHIRTRTYQNGVWLRSVGSGHGWVRPFTSSAPLPCLPRLRRHGPGRVDDLDGDRGRVGGGRVDHQVRGPGHPRPRLVPLDVLVAPFPDVEAVLIRIDARMQGRRVRVEQYVEDLATCLVQASQSSVQLPRSSTVCTATRACPVKRTISSAASGTRVRHGGSCWRSEKLVVGKVVHQQIADPGIRRHGGHPSCGSRTSYEQIR